jgi:hypothetical protein
MQQSQTQNLPAPTMDPAKEIKAWKAYFAYAAQEFDGESPELLVACAHRLLELSEEGRGNRRGGRRRAALPAAE